MSFIQLAGLILLVSFNAMANMAVIKDDGKLSLRKPAQRIISFSPEMTELLFAAGGGDRLVGVVKFSDYPEAAKHIPVIGDVHELDMERIILLKPDLLVVGRQGNPAKQIEQLRQLNIPLLLINSTKLDDIPANIQLLGQHIGTETEATKSAMELRRQLALLTAKYANRSPVTLFYQIWDKPLFTLNGRHIVNDAIRVCGGINIFSALTMTAPKVDSEAVLHADPEAIIGTADRASIAEKKPSEGGVAMWKRYPTMTAVKYHHLFELDGDLINRAGPRMISGTASLCEKLELVREHRHLY